MDDQNEAWRRMTEARLKELEAAVMARPIRRNRDGKPVPPLPYEPGDRKPLTKWLQVRVMALELLFRLMLDVDRTRADDLDVEELEDLIRLQLERMGKWVALQVEPDILTREVIAMIGMADTILMEAHTFPLMDLEEMGL